MACVYAPMRQLLYGRPFGDSMHTAFCNPLLFRYTVVYWYRSICHNARPRHCMRIEMIYLQNTFATDKTNRYILRVEHKAYIYKHSSEISDVIRPRGVRRPIGLLDYAQSVHKNC